MPSAVPDGTNLCAVLALPGCPQSAARARAAVAGIAGLTPGQAADAAVCVTELVANAALHSASGAPGGVVFVVAENTGGRLHIEVRDAGPARPPLPRETARPGLAESGRGLLIVAALSAACGRRGTGSSWCEVAA